MAGRVQLLVTVALASAVQHSQSATLRADRQRLVAAGLANATETGRTGGLRLRTSSNSSRYGPKQAPFFEDDAYKMAEAPDAVPEKPPQCHPQCRWNCGPLSSPCNTACKPSCQPPKCVTACGKPSLSACKQVCQPAHCVVVCPKQCATGRCPECHTVCSEPECKLQCGHSFCESKCADPVCAWNCGPVPGAPSCQEPQCKLECDDATAGCSKNPGLKGEDLPGPRPHDAIYSGQEVGWEGLASLPPEMMKELQPGEIETVGQWTVPGAAPPAPAPAQAPAR